jgi:Fic family protein
MSDRNYFYHSPHPTVSLASHDLLQRVRTQGAWEPWLAFFLEGTEITARGAANAAKQILNLFAQDRDRIQTLGRAASSALRVHEYMQKKPLAGIGALADALQLSIPTVTGALTIWFASA